MATRIYIGKLIEDAELSQLALAKSLGWHQGRISQLVNQVKKPTSKERRVLEQFFGLPADVLFEEISHEVA